MDEKKYTRTWGSNNPGCVVFLVDQSGSMTDPFGGQSIAKGQQKMVAVATVLNNTINEIGSRCVKGDIISPRVHIAIIGYGGNGATSVFSERFREDLVPINELMEHPLRVEKRKKQVFSDTGEILEYPVDFPIWVEPVGQGATPMTEALDFARSIIDEWIPGHRESFPPIVINITDGAATDGDPTEPALRLQQLETDDGKVLLFNCHISDTPGNDVLYPAPGDPLPPDNYAQLLFEMSSELPDSMLQMAKEMNVKPGIRKGARGFLFNTDVSNMVRMIQIATVQRPTSLSTADNDIALDR